MGYVDENLITDEVVTYRGKLHWTGLLGPVSLAAVFMALGLAALWYAFHSENRNLFVGIGLGLIAIGAVPLIKASIQRRAAEFAVTNKRVIFKTGVVHRRTAEMFLSKIESVGADQSVVGRFFGYGSIVLRGTGGSTEPFEKIDKPLEFRRQIQEQIAKLQDQRPSRT
jgi:uncharacterized membrane protein YdbT with pleckstrin-like domain